MAGIEPAGVEYLAQVINHDWIIARIVDNRHPSTAVLRHAWTAINNQIIRSTIVLVKRKEWCHLRSVESVASGAAAAVVSWLKLYHLLFSLLIIDWLVKIEPLYTR